MVGTVVITTDRLAEMEETLGTINWKIASQWRGWLGLPSHPSIVNTIIITTNRLTGTGNLKE